MIIEFQKTVTPYVKGDVADIRDDTARGLIEKGAAKSYQTRDARPAENKQRQSGQ
ncbi:MAG TPA: hypothetical protein VM639_24740 [Dongiaceae bacterium]|nr:hypothetical protein [Dongiaceae bacterium]